MTSDGTLVHTRLTQDCAYQLLDIDPATRRRSDARSQAAGHMANIRSLYVPEKAGRGIQRVVEASHRVDRCLGDGARSLALPLSPTPQSYPHSTNCNHFEAARSASASKVGRLLPGVVELRDSIAGHTCASRTWTREFCRTFRKPAYGILPRRRLHGAELTRHATPSQRIP